MVQLAVNSDSPAVNDTPVAWVMRLRGLIHSPSVRCVFTSSQIYLDCDCHLRKKSNRFEGYRALTALSTVNDTHTETILNR